MKPVRPSERSNDDSRIATIYLMDNASMEEQGESTSNKRCGTSTCECESAHKFVLDKVEVKVHRLKQCSTYFDICMSERWVPTEEPPSCELHFHLEVHTEVQYYKDCFSRMYYLFKPIPSVVHCIELLKVAAQIGFQDVIDIGVKYLTATPWSNHEETIIREFCSSPHLISFAALADLQHFRLQEDLASNAKNLLTCYLEHSFPDLNCRSKFATALGLVMSGVQSGVLSEEVLEHFVALLTQALARLMSRLDDEVENFYVNTSVVEDVLLDICWLFQVARDAKVSQALVVKLADMRIEISISLCLAICRDCCLALKLREWIKLWYAIFQDILEGRLFLDLVQRVRLFELWHWLVFLYFDDEHLRFQALAVKFVMTLPQIEQQDFWRCMRLEPTQRFLWGAHRICISRMVIGTADAQHQAKP